ncbi:sulfate ABC transporter substrate-binding protein [Methylotenera sp.]|uniref:sulfate ABC transporter substrate-binding protein n=1 Tax=Methylotenera sp. TaxID=2051956 RepID=UPI002718ECDF|nr:sulfate ABC transporter substrate-binding protein [Methylotenera sp.]MDO9204795.1 sulfate ABC transporter substrate-binding protein [Methylotenera sp.]MDP2231834.1 sulfate ABC transporter substrate-binding protein [Methylotenera sp.]MDP3005252.1 sulfate ABC transporter substrate-binding protein [Methylotenera sp.]MDP3307651.1 sulfate ABC transporter substrate-binding protein [Methylotenera sp.]MDP3819061.1 sulfate ABC transporter substrate-binding protein [Methylotenera sp.]
MFKKSLLISLLIASTAYSSLSIAAENSLLNVSYDVTREFYKDFNGAFVKYWKEKTGATVTINQSHGGSSKQARSVSDGLEADIITMNQSPDIDILYTRAKLIPKDWQKRLPYASSPTSSTTVFLVRKGNPKQIKDWDDLVKPGIAVVIPNPKTSGNGKYSYLAAWGYVIKKGGDETKAKEFVGKLFKNVPVLDTGGRGATTTFAQRGIGDALLTFENEVNLIKKELGDQYDVVYPSVSILAENPIAVVDKYVDKHKNRLLVQAYAEFHFSETGQEIAAQHDIRPRLESVAEKFKSKFKSIELFSVDEIFGGWEKAQKTHFADGGNFDQIYSK